MLQNLHTVIILLEKIREVCFKTNKSIFVFLSVWFAINCKPSEILKPMNNGKSPLVIGFGDWSSERDCKSCHLSISKNHQKSAHAYSWKDPIFREAFKKEPKQWCMNCHAPLHNFDTDFDYSKLLKSQITNELWTEGVNCAVCHVRGNEIFGKRNRNDIKDHRVLEDKSFFDNSLCQNCHQFNFPKKHYPEIEYTNVVMQGTDTESHDKFSYFSNSDHCINCHLKKDHKLNGTVFDSDWPENWNVKIETISKGKENIVNLAMEYPKMGHKFPTGDLFRSLVFRIFDKKQSVIVEYRFEKKMRLIDLYEIQDTRLSPYLNRKFTKSFKIKEMPFTCELVYHLQFPIEHELIDQLKGVALERKIYRSSCRINSK